MTAATAALADLPAAELAGTAAALAGIAAVTLDETFAVGLAEIPTALTAPAKGLGHGHWAALACVDLHQPCLLLPSQLVAWLLEEFRSQPEKF